MTNFLALLQKIVLQSASLSRFPTRKSFVVGREHFTKLCAIKRHTSLFNLTVALPRQSVKNNRLFNCQHAKKKKQLNEGKLV